MHSEKFFEKTQGRRAAASRIAFAGTLFAGALLAAGTFAGCSSPPEAPAYAAKISAKTEPSTPETLRAEIDALLAEAAPEAGFKPYVISSAGLSNYVDFLVAGAVKKGVPVSRAAVPITALVIASAFEKKGEYSKAVHAYEDIMVFYADSDYAAEALYRIGELYSRRHQFVPAFDCFSALEDSYPASPRVKDSIVQSYLIVENIRAGVRPRKGGWFPWFKDRSEALKIYERLYEMAPHAPVSPRLLFNKGTLAFELSEDWFSFDKTVDAIDAFERLISIYPESEFVPDAYLQLAGTYEAGVVGADWDQLSSRRAINYYTDFYSLFPEHEKAEFAYEKTVELTNLMAANRVVLGDFYYSRHNNLRAAATFYNEAITIAPDSPAGEKAAEQIARIRRGERSERTLVDWIFGRYPNYDAVDYLDAPSLRPLDEMGFRSNSSNSAEGGSAGTSGTNAAGSGTESGSAAGPQDN